MILYSAVNSARLPSGLFRIELMSLPRLPKSDPQSVPVLPEATGAGVGAPPTPVPPIPTTGGVAAGAGVAPVAFTVGPGDGAGILTPLSRPSALVFRKSVDFPRLPK